MASGRAPTPWTTTALGTQTDGRSPGRRRPRRALRARSPPRRPDGSLGVGVASMAESGVLLADDGRRGRTADRLARHPRRGRDRRSARRARGAVQRPHRAAAASAVVADQAPVAARPRRGGGRRRPSARGGGMDRARARRRAGERAVAGLPHRLARPRPPRLVGRGAGVERRPRVPAARAGGLRRTGRDRARPLGHPRPRRRRADRRRARPPGRGHRRRRRPGARRARFLRHRRGLRAHGAARAAPRRHPRPHRRGDHRRLARPARALVPAGRDPRRPRPAARPGPARTRTRRPRRRSTPPPCASNPARWRSPAPTGHRSACATSATTSTPPGSGGPPSPPPSTPVGTSTTP